MYNKCLPFYETRFHMTFHPIMYWQFCYKAYHSQAHGPLYWNNATRFPPTDKKHNVFGGQQVTFPPSTHECLLRLSSTIINNVCLIEGFLHGQWSHIIRMAMECNLGERFRDMTRLVIVTLSAHGAPKIKGQWRITRPSNCLEKVIDLMEYVRLEIFYFFIACVGLSQFHYGVVIWW